MRSRRALFVVGLLMVVVPTAITADDGVKTDTRSLLRTQELNRKSIQEAEQTIAILERFLQADVLLVGPWLEVRIPLTAEEAGMVTATRMLRRATEAGLPPPTRAEIAREIAWVRDESARAKTGLRQEVEKLEEFVERTRRANVQIGEQIAALQPAARVRLSTDTWEGTWDCKGAGHVRLRIDGRGTSSTITGEHFRVRFGPTASESYQIDEVTAERTVASGRYLYRDKNPQAGPPRKDEEGKPVGSGARGQWPGTWKISCSGEQLTLQRFDDASSWSGTYRCEKMPR